MKQIPVRQLKPGMVTASDVITKRGQLIAQKGTALSSQLIARLSFYRIESVDIDMPEEEKPAHCRGLRLAVPVWAALRPAAPLPPSQKGRAVFRSCPSTPRIFLRIQFAFENVTIATRRTDLRRKHKTPSGRPAQSTDCLRRPGGAFFFLLGFASGRGSLSTHILLRRVWTKDWPALRKGRSLHTFGFPSTLANRQVARRTGARRKSAT